MLSIFLYSTKSSKLRVLGFLGHFRLDLFWGLVIFNFTRVGVWECDVQFKNGYGSYVFDGIPQVFNNLFTCSPVLRPLHFTRVLVTWDLCFHQLALL